MEFIKPGININFVGRRNLAFLISGLLILMTIVSLLLHGGPNYGIDFAGGILVQVKFKQPTDAPAIKEALRPIDMADSLVQPFGREGNEYLIRAEKKDLDLQGLGDRVRQSLSAAYKDGFEVRRVEMVGPKVGADLRRKALLAIFYAILMIAVYISGRFEAKWALAAVMAAALVGATLLVQAFVVENGSGGSGVVYLIITALVVTVGACWLLRLRYALGAIVALIHDVIITVGVFSILDKEFTLATVAALLTIIGYSLNDTIIVFDRIRENLKKAGRKPLGSIINSSVNQTLSRTILTSGTTLAVLLCLFILGGGVIEDFALALLVGVIVGTYSSVFVASPILLVLPEGRPAFSMAKAPATARKPQPAPAPAPEPKRTPPPAKAAASKKRSRKKKNKRKKK
ncbi:MAG: protein translocase subunit SecF [Desulfarculaceae bacterium]|jgi:preprotein translocase subunit SecF